MVIDTGLAWGKLDAQAAFALRSGSDTLYDY